MSIFKYAIFSLLLAMPLIGGAYSMTIEPLPLGGIETSIVNPIPLTDLSAVVIPSSGPFFDIWNLVVDANFTADIIFHNFNATSFFASGATSPLSSTGPHEFGGVFGPGEYKFAVFGDTPMNGVYIAQATFSAIPLPSAVWLFGTVLFGFLSISKYRHQI